MKFAGFSDLQVSLMVDGLQLAEYDDEDEFPHIDRQTKYVEATSGTNFSVKLRIPPQLYPNDEIECRIYLDGTFVTGKVYYKHCDRTESFRVDGRQAFGSDGRPTLERFTFAELHTNDSAAKADLKEKFKDLGTIQLDFYRTLEVGVDREGAHTKWNGIGAEGIPEKGLKGRAISNQATLSKPEVIRQPLRFVKLEYPYGYKAFLGVTYKYRSRRDLQIEGIIPRTPSPVPLEERDPNDLSTEEARELVRRMRERQITIKQEFKSQRRSRDSTVIDEDNDDDVTIASENDRGNKRPRLTERDSGVEIVDLTDD